MVWAIVAMTALMMFVSLAVDLGRVQLAKTELSRATDAAARYAVSGITSGPATVRSRAKQAVADNTVDGVPLVLNDSDIEFGTWDSSSKTFTPVSGSAESSATIIRITAVRNTSRGNAIPLIFARVLGMTTCNIKSTVVLKGTYQVNGFVGFGDISMKNNTYIGSYNSGTSSTPGHGGGKQKGALVSNGSITGGNNNVIDGDLVLGPNGHVDNGVTVNGTTMNEPALPKPASPPWNPGVNPGAIPQSYTVNSDTTLPGGTYWFTYLSINATLQFSGPTTLYVNGDIDLNGAIKPVSGVPSDLKIYQIGARTFSDSSNNNLEIIAIVSAPDTAFAAKNNLVFQGAGSFDTIDLQNNADFYFDETLGSATGSTVISTYQ